MANQQAPTYSWQDAIRQRLAAIQDLSASQTTWENYQQQKRMLQQQQAQRMSGLNAQMQGMQQAASSGGTGYTGARGSDDFERFVDAIGYLESGNNYNPRYYAGNPYNAMGKYSILASNLGGQKSGWDYNVLGYDVTPAQFRASPEIQEKVGRYYLQQYYNKYGAAGAAVAWYAGEGTAQKWLKAGGGSTYNKGQAGGYPSINAYVQKLYARMNKK